MTLRKSDLQALKNGIDAFDILFLDSEVALQGGGTVTVPCYVTRRQARGDGMTEGINQYETLALFKLGEWDAAFPGRPPSKNDVVTYQGRRYALDSVVDVKPADVEMLYRCRVKG